MAGIINDASNPYKIPGTVDSNQQGATNYGVTKDMTVQGQLKNVMDPNAPLMQQAQTQGKQMSADRGLINSSMGVTAGMDSMYRTAVPIATADAGTFAKTASDNAGNATSMSNAATSAAASRYGADKSAEASMFSTNKNYDANIYGTNVNASTQKYNTDTSAATQRYSTDQTNATNIATNKLSNETSLANTNSNNATSIANTAANNATSTTNTALNNKAQTDIAKAHDDNAVLINQSTGANSAFSNYQSTLNNIMTNDKLTDAAKTTAMENAKIVFNDAMAAYVKSSGGKVPDVSSHLEFSAVDTGGSGNSNPQYFPDFGYPSGG